MVIDPERIESEYIENKMTFIGLAALHDPPRPKTEKAVEQAHQAGVRVIMITGDHELTAKAIAKKTSIISDEECEIVSGPELNKMSEAKLSDKLKGMVAFARAAPENKLRIVKAFLKRGDTVAVTGDGVNDAPALTQSDIGISMGSGTDVARESSDVVLLDNDFASIVEAIKLGRGIFDNLRKFAYYMYSHCFAELITFVAFILCFVHLFRSPSWVC
jgi:magnesium-transporting ATPase (P-type)